MKADYVKVLYSVAGPCQSSLNSMNTSNNDAKNVLGTFRSTYALHKSRKLLILQVRDYVCRQGTTVALGLLQDS